MRRGCNGTFHRIEPIYLHRYINEFAGRLGMRALCTVGKMCAMVQNQNPERFNTQHPAWASVKLQSGSFRGGSEIPPRHGYKKKNISPPLSISKVPEGTQSLALIMDDPDAMAPAGKVWVHWLLWNIDPATTKIPEGTIPDGAIQGKTDFGETGYGGPAPPDKRHTYVFKLYALDSTLSLKEGSAKKKMESAIKGHILAEATLTGTYAP